MVLETLLRSVSKTQRAEGMVPNRLRKCGRYIYRYVGGTIVGLSYMSFQNRHSVKTSHVTMASREV